MAQGKLRALYLTIKHNAKRFFFHLQNSLRRIYYQIYSSMKIFYRSPFSFFLMVILPIIFLLLFGSIFAHNDVYNFHLEIQDNDNTALSDLVIQRLGDIDVLELHELSSDYNPREYSQENGLDTCLIIPNNWANDVLASSEPVNVTLIMNPLSESSRLVSDIVIKTINELNLEFNSTESIIGLNEIDYVGGNLKYIDFVLPGIIGVIVMNIGILGTLNRQMSFKESKLANKLATTPLTRLEYFISEVLWQFIIAFFATLLATTTAWIVFGFSWSSFHVLVLPILAVGVLMFFGMGLVLSLFIESQNNAITIGTIITIPLLFLSGVFFDISRLPVLLVISNFSPLTFIINALRAGMITGNFSLAWMNIGISMAIAAVAIIIGVSLTKWQTD
jgi:ABC-2 type transport system permease protein